MLKQRSIMEVSVSALVDVRPSQVEPGRMRRFQRPAEAAGLLGVLSANTLYRQLQAGRFPAIRIGQKRLVVPGRALTAFETAAYEGREVRPDDWDTGWTDERFFHLGEAAELLTVATGTLSRLLRSGQFPGVRLGTGRSSRWYVPARAIDSAERRSLEQWRPVDIADYAEPASTPAWATVPGLTSGGAA